MAAREGQHEQRGLTARGRRFFEVASFAVALMAPSAALAGTHDERDPDNTWAQVMGENTAERMKEIEELEKDCRSLEREIVAREIRIDEGGKRYDENPGLKLIEKQELEAKRRELKRKRAVIERLSKGAQAGMDRQVARRAAWEDPVPLGPGLDTALDLSARALGNENIAGYYSRWDVDFRDHAFQFDGSDGTRLQFTVGPDLTDADFYLADGHRVLLVVFTEVDGTHATLRLREGVYEGLYESDAKGKPERVPLTE